MSWPGHPAPHHGTSQTAKAKPRGAKSCLSSSPRSSSAGGFKNKREVRMVSGLTPALPCPGRALRFAPRQHLSCNSLSLLRRQREARGAGEPAVSERARCKKKKTNRKSLFSSSLLLAAAQGWCKTQPGCSPHGQPSTPACRCAGSRCQRWLWHPKHGGSEAAPCESSAGARRQLRPSLPPFDVAAIFIGGRNHLPSTRPCLARSRGDVSPGGCPLLALRWQDGVCEGLAGPWGTRDAQGRCPSQPWGAHVRLLVMSTACFLLFLFLLLLPSLSQGQF